jgi:hypothetical protein
MAYHPFYHPQLLPSLAVFLTFSWRLRQLLQLFSLPHFE